MINAICKAPTSELKELNNLFIELTEKNCTQRCKHCWIDFGLTKNVKDFISPDLVRQTLIDTKGESLKCIYLTGAEPMTHPDFNAILRMCLKRTNVCIHTNGHFINEKKARFLKKVEDESKFEIIFKFSIDHWDELKNDDIRSRGSWRQTVCAIKSVVKYGFEPILCVTNYYKEDRKELAAQLRQVCERAGFNAKERHIVINDWYDKQHPAETGTKWCTLDCEHGRILTTKGVYTCAFLANDHRGRCGADFTDYTRKNVLESTACANCIKNKTAMFAIDYKLFA